MKTQKQQLLDYLAIHASVSELLELCSSIQGEYVAAESFLKDVAVPQDTKTSTESVTTNHQKDIDDEVYSWLLGYERDEVVHISQIIQGTGLERMYVWPSLQRLKSLSVLDLGYDQYVRK